MKPIISLLTVMVIAAAACSQSAENPELSNIPGVFIDIGYGARPMGMCGAFVGLADDHNAAIWNPAGMLNVQGNGISFMWAKQLGFIPYNYLSYSGEISANHRIGGALIFSGDDLLSENTALLSYATGLGGVRKYLNRIYLGINIKVRWASFGNNSGGDPDRITGDAFGYGFDLGLMVKLSEKINTGVLFRDIVNDITWNSSSSGKYSEDVPGEFTMGISVKPTPKVIIASDLRKSLHRDVEDRWMIGAEYQVFSLMKLRAGWGRNIDAEYENQDIAVGVGLFRNIGKMEFMFDFAYMINDLKNTPRLGACFNW